MKVFSPKRLRSERLRADLRQEDLALASGRYKSDISRYEKGHSQPSASTLGAIASALRCPVDAFYVDDGRSVVAVAAQVSRAQQTLLGEAAVVRLANVEAGEP